MPITIIAHLYPRVMCNRFRIVLFGLLLFASSSVYAQKEANTWYFGAKAGFDFSVGSPLTLSNSSMRGGYTAGIISDKTTGQLLFYSDGERVWNRNHRLMPHGDSLRGFRYVTQAALTFPVPDQPDRYYLFTMDTTADLRTKLFCSVVDMRLAGGLGDVVSELKNQPIAGDFTGQLTAIPHTNGRDFWVLARQWASNIFRVYLVDSRGVALVHAAGLGPAQPPNPQLIDVAESYLKASPNGKKVAYVTSGQPPRGIFGLLDFNAGTGQLSHYVDLGPLLAAGGLSFSPDNSKLYVQNYSSAPNGGGDRNIISQYDLAAGSDQAIAASGLSIIADNPDTNISAAQQASAGIYALQLGPDGRLYGNSGYVDASAPARPGQENLYVIQYPNRRGFACQVRYQTFDFGSGTASPGFPNFLQSYFDGLVPSISPVGECAEAVLDVFPNPTAGTVRFQLPEACFTPYAVILYNAIGQVVYRTQVDTALSQTIDIGSLAPGVYMIEAQFSNRTMIKKLVKAPA